MSVDKEDLSKVVIRIKEEYENAIINGLKTEKIRSQGIIKLLHEYVARELMRNGIPKNWIHHSAPIHGFPKTKEQDILVEPPMGIIRKGNRSIHVGPLMSINIRSQLSSIEKNYDTLYERLFAEALNIHNRFPFMVLGYVYLLPLVGYDVEASNRNEIKFGEYYNLEKYIVSFSRINGRRHPSEDSWKYERICLLLVDFEESPPQIVEDNSYLVNKNRISEDFAKKYDIKDLGISSFFDDIIAIFYERYYDILV